MTGASHELVLGDDGLIGTEVVDILRTRGADMRSADLWSGNDIASCDDGPFEWADRVWFLAWYVGGSKYLGDPASQHTMFMNS